jgi:phosphate transport system substrate-binding protein
MNRVASILAIALFCTGCSDRPKTDVVYSDAPAGLVLINGAGATFPYPIYSKWFDQYHRLFPQIQINYQSIGSGGGIRQVIEGTVDFGATDSPMTDAQLREAKTKILHFPTVLGAVVPVYNIPGITEEINGITEINFTPDALAGIFLGKITKWNDPELKSVNAGLNLPDKGIVVVHRSDGSGTTYVWTDYLGKVSPEWKSKVGVNTSVNWPAGLGGKGNEGVAGLIKQTPYSIGYLEFIYAIHNKMAYGRVRNSDDNFVKADLDSVAAAAAGVKTIPADFRVSITNASGHDSYPISSFTWLLIPSKIPVPAKKEAIVDFLNWMLDDGQQMVEALAYAKLPKELVEMEQKAIASIE